MSALDTELMKALQALAWVREGERLCANGFAVPSPGWADGYIDRAHDAIVEAIRINRAASNGESEQALRVTIRYLEREIEAKNRYINEIKYEPRRKLFIPFEATQASKEASIAMAVKAYREALEILLEALEMVRDADNDCGIDGLRTLPSGPRAKIDAAIAKALASIHACRTTSPVAITKASGHG